MLFFSKMECLLFIAIKIGPKNPYGKGVCCGIQIPCRAEDDILKKLRDFLSSNGCFAKIGVHRGTEERLEPGERDVLAQPTMR